MYIDTHTHTYMHTHRTTTTIVICSRITLAKQFSSRKVWKKSARLKKGKERIWQEWAEEWAPPWSHCIQWANRTSIYWYQAFPLKAESLTAKDPELCYRLFVWCWHVCWEQCSMNFVSRINTKDQVICNNLPTDVNIICEKSTRTIREKSCQSTCNDTKMVYHNKK